MADISQILDPKIVKELQKINSELIKSGETADKIIPSFEKLNKASRELGKASTATGKARKKLTSYQKEAQKITSQLEQVEGKINAQNTKKAKQLQVLQERQKQQLQLLRAEAKVKAAAVGSNEKLAATISLYEKRLKTVNQTTAKGKAQAEKLRQGIDQMNQKLTQQSSQLTKTKRNIGNYKSALAGMGMRVKRVAMQIAGALGLTSAIFILVNVLKGSINTIRQFGKENAVLAGILGTTRKEVKQLTNQAITLGAVYPVTASEVTKLQVSFARLGFTQSEIINLTEATIQGSIALNAELDATATLVGAVVRAYSDLGTQDAGAIIDKLTLATQRSSMSFSSLETALPKVAGAANAMNYTLDETLALLGIAQDATLDASVSGTSLRNILLEIAKEGVTLEEALTDINSSSNKLTRAYQLFGKRAAIVALAFADNTEKAGSFTEAINQAGGTSERVAEVQMDTLDGAIKNLESSWEKFVLSFKESEGALSGVIRRVTNILDVESDEFITRWEKFIKRLPNFILPLDLLFGKGIDKRIEKRRELLEFLNEANQEELEDTFATYIEKANEGDKFSKKIIEITLSRLRTIEKAEQDAAVRKRVDEQEAELERIIALEEQTKAEKQAAKKRAEAWAEETWRKAKLLKEQEAAQSEYLESFKELISDETEITEDNLTDQVESTLRYGEQILENQKKLKEKEVENEKRAEEQKQQFREQSAQYAIQQSSMLANTLYSLKIDQLNREFQAAEGNERKQAELKREIAKQEKRQALFNIAINTAVAVSKVLGQTGIFGLAAWIPVAALGAVQAATVAAQPIPKFAKGTDYSPEGMAVVGEKGRELIQTPKGEVFMANNPALVNLERGTTVLSNRKTEAYLDDTNIVNEMRAVRRAIKEKPVSIIDDGGRIIGKQINSYREIYINRLKHG